MARIRKTDDGTFALFSPRGRMLLALRAAPMYSGQIAERFGHGASGTLASLVREGYVAQRGDAAYTLTESGRDHCPTRRSVLALRAAA